MKKYFKVLLSLSIVIILLLSNISFIYASDNSSNKKQYKVSGNILTDKNYSNYIELDDNYKYGKVYYKNNSPNYATIVVKINNNNKKVVKVNPYSSNFIDFSIEDCLTAYIDINSSKNKLNGKVWIAKSSDKSEFESNYKEKENDIYIRTEEVPKEAEECAKSLFLSTTYKDIKYLGIDANIDDLSLSKGIKGNFCNDNDNDNEKYYFFVLDGNRIVAHINVGKVEKEKYTGSYSSGIFESLNKITNTLENPISIIVGYNAIYYLNNDNLEVISNNVMATDETISNDKSIIESKKSLYLENKNSNAVLIGKDNIISKINPVLYKTTGDIVTGKVYTNSIDLNDKNPYGKVYYCNNSSNKAKLTVKFINGEKVFEKNVYVDSNSSNYLIFEQMKGYSTNIEISSLKGDLNGQIWISKSRDISELK